jgi:hypothetical protein
MAATPEAKTKAAIKKFLDNQGFWRAGAKRPEEVIGWYYMPVSNGMGVHGVPDFVCVCNGWALFIEAKAPGGKCTENQIRRHEEIRAAGGLVIVAYSVDDVAEVFNAWVAECMTMTQ